MLSVRWILSELKKQDVEKLSFSSRLKTPECESIVDEGDHWPDKEEGEGDWEGARVEAVHHRAP